MRHRRGHRHHHIGHDVIVFAPADGQSGNSGRITLGKPVEIIQAIPGWTTTS